MILKNKNEILNWLKIYDHEFEINIKSASYQFIDIVNMKKNCQLSDEFCDYFKNQGHQYILSVQGNVNLYNGALTQIPMQFYHIDSDFDCANNQLISLKGCPLSVGDIFDCSENQLISLEYLPKDIGTTLYCSNNHLKSLEYCPQSINGSLYCNHNQIQSLDFLPDFINGNIYLYHNLELLKYKHQSYDIKIQNMSDDEFLNQKDLSFWHPFYLQEKINKENSKIINNLKLDENKHLIKKTIGKKV